jgi:hypothetical protein
VTKACWNRSGKNQNAQASPPRHAYKLTSNGLAFAREMAAIDTASTFRRKLTGATTRPHEPRLCAGLRPH